MAYMIVAPQPPARKFFDQLGIGSVCIMKFTLAIIMIKTIKIKHNNGRCLCSLIFFLFFDDCFHICNMNTKPLPSLSPSHEKTG